jgi:hypothetical protein
MNTLEDIERAVAKLTLDELARFRVWFDAYDAIRFDQKVERDIRPGKLDQAADQTAVDLRRICTED